MCIFYRVKFCRCRVPKKIKTTKIIYSLMPIHVCTVLQARVQTICGVCMVADCEKQFCKCWMSAIIIVLVRRAGVSIIADGITKCNSAGTTLD